MFRNVGILHSQRRFLIRPVRTKYKKAQKGFFTVNSGGSLAGTIPFYANYALCATEGGRLKEKQLDNARTAIRRAIKAEKGSKVFLRAFPDRPVTSKGSEARMGKGKGAVDFFAKWVSDKSIIFEVSGVRRETAVEAMRVAGAVLPLKTKFVEAADTQTCRTAPRVLPHFIKKRIDSAESRAYSSILRDQKAERSLQNILMMPITVRVESKGK